MTSWLSIFPSRVPRGNASAGMSGMTRAYGTARPAGALEIVSVQHWAIGLPLNQGDLGSCTANALCGALDSAPDFIQPRQRASFLPGTRTAKRWRTR